MATLTPHSSIPTPRTSTRTQHSSILIPRTSTPTSQTPAPTRRTAIPTGQTPIPICRIPAPIVITGGNGDDGGEKGKLSHPAEIHRRIAATRPKKFHLILHLTNSLQAVTGQYANIGRAVGK